LAPRHMGWDGNKRTTLVRPLGYVGPFTAQPTASGHHLSILHHCTEFPFRRTKHAVTPLVFEPSCPDGPRPSPCGTGTSQKFDPSELCLDGDPSGVPIFCT